MSNDIDCCCCDEWWDRYKYHIIAKGSIVVAVLSSTFSFLDTYFPEYALAKHISLAFLNVGIVLSGYAFGKIELKAELLDNENKSLLNDKNDLMKRLTMFQFPASTLQNTPIEHHEPFIEISEKAYSTALPTPFNSELYLNSSNNNFITTTK